MYKKISRNKSMYKIPKFWSYSSNTEVAETRIVSYIYTLLWVAHDLTS